MSTLTAAGRLEALKRSLEVARDVQHTCPDSVRALHESHVKGLRAGLQIAISAIEAELRFIQAWDALATIPQIDSTPA